MNNRMKKNDLYLIIIILGIALISFGAYSFLSNEGNGKVCVQVDGEIVGTYDLSEDQVIEINNGTNQLEIKGHKANMIWADCPDQVCVHQREVSKQGESIICLPNKVVVYISDGKESEFDAIAQ